MTTTMTMTEVTRHYTDGRFVESHGREVYDSINPSTGDVIGRITLGDVADTRRAIAAAKKAFGWYSISTAAERAGYLRRLHEAVAARVDDLTDVMTLEFGGASTMNRMLTERAADSFLTAEAALHEMTLTRTIGLATVSLEPMGVAGLITPWNSSATFICGKLAAALAAGCTAVIKPSEMSGLQTQVLLEALHEADLPPGLINVVNGRGDVVGAEITRHPDVAKISFTGSTQVGQAIARDGAATMKRVTLELGGKSPNVLLPDVDLDQAIPVALGIAYFNSGQGCVAGTRLLVPEARLDEVKDAILSAMATVKVGPPSDPSTTVGPMVSQKQYDRVQHYIHAGIEQGAELLTGGPGHPDGLSSGFFVKPTVFINVTNDMTIAREEIFGPVLSVLTYIDEADAIKIANDTPYGLAAYVSSADDTAAHRVASQIRAGRVSIGVPRDEAGAPFGGFKLSGVGREFGTYGIEAFMETRSIIG